MEGREGPEKTGPEIKPNTNQKVADKIKKFLEDPSRIRNINPEEIFHAHRVTPTPEIPSEESGESGKVKIEKRIDDDRGSTRTFWTESVEGSPKSSPSDSEEFKK